MNKIVLSLLKGNNTNKLELLKENLSFKQLINLCESDELKTGFNLEKGYAFSRLEEILGITHKKNILTFSYNETEYPTNLKDIYDPPFMIYVRGDKKVFDGDFISVVGTRKPTLRGFHESFRLGLDLGREDVGVVSGLAMGIDGAAHSGNVESGGRTIAVLGSGVDTIYPTSNRALAGSILQNGGAIVSEFPPGESPKRFNFPKRNRVIAGLSRHLVIIQAPKKSGALITGDFALNNGGDIFVHSVGVNDVRFLGSDRYFKDGAKKIDSAYPLLKLFEKGLNTPAFDSSDYKNEDLLKLELSGEIIKYKGCYFKR